MQQVPTVCSQSASSWQPEAQEPRGQCQESHQPRTAAPAALPAADAPLFVSIFCVFFDDWILVVAQILLTARYEQEGRGLYEQERLGLLWR